MSLFQSNLRKQIRKLPKILKFVRIIHYYSKLFSGVLNGCTGDVAAGVPRPRGPSADAGRLPAARRGAAHPPGAGGPPLLGLAKLGKLAKLIKIENFKF